MPEPRDLLAPVGGSLRTRLCLYRGSKRIAQATLPPGEISRIELNGRVWRLDFSTDEAEPDGLRLTLTGRAEGAKSPPCSFGFEIELEGWSEEHYVVLPGAAYRGNRFVAKPLEYPCILIDPEDFRPDVPNTISEVPRLTLGEGHSAIQLLAGDMSTPAIGVFFPKQRQALWLLTSQRTDLGENGIEIEESESRDTACLRAMAPGIREGLRYSGGPKWVPSEDRGGRLRPGEEVSLNAWLYRFPAESIHDLFARLLDIRKAPFGSRPRRHELPWSAAWERLEHKYNEVNWDEHFGYYACGDRQSRYAQWQIGWVGGMISSHALMAAGRPESQRRARRNMDFASGPGQAPSGLYWSVGIDGEMFSDMVDMSWGEDWHLVRRSGDALYFMLRQIRLTADPPTAWSHSCRRCADAFVSMWRRFGQFGQFVSEEDGTIRVGGTASGAIAIGGLALASQVLNSNAYLETAEGAARYYAREFLDRGFTSGGPGEAAQCPDSESAFGLLESLVVLWEVTQDREWLDLAERAAAHAASWVMSYDFAFPKNSTFGRLDMRTTGSVWANAQNKHSAPGICTLSGVSLFRLFRATGDVRYLDLAADVSHGISQYLSRSDRPVFEMPEGFMCERVNTSDWESPYIPPGEGFHGGCWCEVSAMLTWVEMPGLYVQPDTGFARALDHVDVLSVSTAAVEIRNPTKFDLRLKVFVERSKEMGRPLAPDFMASVEPVLIKAGEVVRIVV